MHSQRKAPSQSSPTGFYKNCKLIKYSVSGWGGEETVKQTRATTACSANHSQLGCEDRAVTVIVSAPCISLQAQCYGQATHWLEATPTYLWIWPNFADLQGVSEVASPTRVTVVVLISGFTDHLLAPVSMEYLAFFSICLFLPSNK